MKAVQEYRLGVQTMLLSMVICPARFFGEQLGGMSITALDSFSTFTVVELAQGYALAKETQAKPMCIYPLHFSGSFNTRSQSVHINSFG